jgi:cation transport ATPase
VGFVIGLPYCQKCGAEIAADAAFCPRCGQQTAVSPAPVERGHEREEKREKSEKREKEEKGEKEEKSEDKTLPLVGGLILVWLGISFYLVQAHYIDWNEWWPYFLIGIGVVLILQAVVRYSSSRFRGVAMGTLIGGAVLLIIGLAGMTGMKDWWAFVLIAIGLVVIIGGMTARMRTPKPGEATN